MQLTKRLQNHGVSASDNAVLQFPVWLCVKPQCRSWSRAHYLSGQLWGGQRDPDWFNRYSSFQRVQVFVPAWVNFKGTAYRAGMTVFLSCNPDGKPQFGLIKAILVLEQTTHTPAITTCCTEVGNRMVWEAFFLLHTVWSPLKLWQLLMWESCLIIIHYVQSSHTESMMIISTLPCATDSFRLNQLSCHRMCV